jgi:hypothetical protein
VGRDLLPDLRLQCARLLLLVIGTGGRLHAAGRLRTRVHSHQPHKRPVLAYSKIRSPSAKAFAHFARMRSSSALLERAMTGKVFLRRRLIQCGHPCCERSIGLPSGSQTRNSASRLGGLFLDVGRGAPLIAHRNQGLNALHLDRND